MKVSIITTCYNRETTIRGAIESVLAQDYPHIEYIVVDGASKDGSLDVINEYRGKITKIVSEPDHGMYEAINKGIRMATGDVIGLVHSDEFFFQIFSKDTLLLCGGCRAGFLRRLCVEGDVIQKSFYYVHLCSVFVVM